MDTESLEKNFEQIIKETNKYLKKYSYKNQNEELISVDIENCNGKYKLNTYPRGTFWSKFIVYWNSQMDIYIKNEDSEETIKLASQGNLYNDYPELLVGKLFQDLLDEKDYLKSEIKNYENIEKYR